MTPRQNIHDPALGNDPADLQKLGILRALTTAMGMTPGQREAFVAGATGRPVAVEPSERVREPMSKRDALEAEFLARWRAAGGPELTRQHVFDANRKWAWDFCVFEPVLFAIEIDGLVHGGKGGHQTVKGVKEQCEKSLRAWLAGWQHVRLTRQQITPEHIEAILRRLSRL